MAGVKSRPRMARALRAVEALIIMLVIPLLLWRLGAKYLPYQWEDVLVAAYFGGAVIWNAVRKRTRSIDTLAALEVKAEDPRASALDMMVELREYLGTASASDWRIPHMIRLVHCKMVAESMIDRMKSKAKTTNADQ